MRKGVVLNDNEMKYIKKISSTYALQPNGLKLSIGSQGRAYIK